MCHFRTREVLPAAAALPFAHGNKDGSQSSSSLSSETLFIREGAISRPVNPHLTSFTPSRPCGPTPGLTSTNFDLSPPSSEAPPVPVTPNLTWGLPTAQSPASCDLLGRPSGWKPHVLFSFPGEPQLQVSQMTPGELELLVSFRLAFVDLGWY